MNNLESIEYIVKHSKALNEWEEAGMWNAVQIIIGNSRKFWTSIELQALLTTAMNN